MRSVKKSLSLEVLEPRALFAAPVDLSAQFELVKLAILSSAPIELSPDPLLGAARWILHGSSDANLTIDFDKLPSFVTSISVTSFDTVKFDGTDGLFNLIATDVRALEAPSISVAGYFIASNVDKISLKSVVSYLQIEGNNVEAKIDDLTGFNGRGTPIHLRALNSLTLETESANLNFESIWNSRGLVIALPNVPSSWDPANPASWKGVSGLDNIQSQLRLGTRDVSVASDVEEVPATNSDDHSSVSEQPDTTPPTAFVSDIDLRAFLDRLEILFNQAGGFGATGLDTSTVKRVVAELSSHSQESVNPALNAPLAQIFARREIYTPSASDHMGANLFAPVTDAKTPIVLSPDQLGSDLVFNLAVEPSDREKSEVAYSLVENPLRPLENSEGTPAATVHVTIDPEAPVDAPRLGLMSIISLFMDRAVDLKQYVINQLTQEVVPGERTGVLLVDPKPVRSVQHVTKV